MVQTSNRFFDEVARLMNDAAGAAQGVRREFETLFRTQAERVLRDLDVVRRDDFEAVKDMARIAREENEALKARVAALEASLGKSASGSSAGSAETPPGGPSAGIDPGAAAGPA
jgi:BMFP domain-containing protein YqiC